MRLVDNGEHRPQHRNLEVRDGVGHRYAFAYFHQRAFGDSSWEVWAHGVTPTDWACTEVRTADQAVELLRDHFPAAVSA